MKIAMPVDEPSMTSHVSLSFGRASCFLIYDTESKESSFVDNHASSSQGGAGIKAAQMIVDSHVNALLTPQCGENAATVMKEANIKIYKTMSDSISDNISAFNEGRIMLLAGIHAGFHGHGGN